MCTSVFTWMDTPTFPTCEIVRIILWGKLKQLLSAHKRAAIFLLFVTCNNPDFSQRTPQIEAKNQNTSSCSCLDGIHLLPVSVDKCQQVSLNHTVYILRVIMDCHQFLMPCFAQHHKESSSPFSVIFYLVPRNKQKKPTHLLGNTT